MAGKIHANHGRDHRRGASDPIGQPMVATFVGRDLTPQTIADNTVTLIAFDNVYYDSDDWVDLGVSTTNLYVPETGIYTVWARVRWVSATAGTRRLLAIQQNVVSGPLPSGIVSSLDVPNGLVNPDMTVSYTGLLQDDHSLSLKVLQQSGGSLDVTVAAMSATFVSEYTP